MLQNKLKGFNIILASASPRRKQLLQELGITFKQLSKDVNETYPDNLSPVEIAEYLSKLKAEAFSEEELNENEIIITADTIVSLNGEILGKPTDKEHAFAMLAQLSGNTHEVITAVTLKSKIKKTTFSVLTLVKFKELTAEEIEYYIDNYQPFDKAGAYGIQEWIGYAAIEQISGSYPNVVGLPTHQLYAELEQFLSDTSFQ